VIRTCAPAALAAVLLGACAPGVPTTGAASPLRSGAPIRFSVSSHQSPYVITGDFIGRTWRAADSLIVEIDSARVVRRGRPSAQSSPFAAVTVRAALAAEGRSGGWTLGTLSAPFPLRDPLHPGDTVALGALRLAVRLLGPETRDEVLERRWLVFQFAATDPRDGHAFTTYVCSRRDLFRDRQASDSSNATDLAYAIRC
jgi:hypothetical protein